MGNYKTKRDSLRRLACHAREQLPGLPIHGHQPRPDHGCQQAEAEGLRLGRADRPQGQGPHAPPQPVQLRPGLRDSAVRARGLAAGHLPEAAQHIGAPLSSPLLSQQLAQHREQGHQLAGRHHGWVLGEEHRRDLEPGAAEGGDGRKSEANVMRGVVYAYGGSVHAVVARLLDHTAERDWVRCPGVHRDDLQASVS